MATPVKPTPSSPFPRAQLANTRAFTTRQPAAVLLLLAVSSLASPPSLQAQQSVSLAEAAQRGQAIFDQSAVTGMVLAIVHNHEVLIKGYGETAPGSGRTPDSSSEVRLCSISKVFTSDLLTKLVSEGNLSLTDPLLNTPRRTAKSQRAPTEPTSHCSIWLPTPPACRAKSAPIRPKRPTSPSPTVPTAGPGCRNRSSHPPPAQRPSTPTSATICSATPWPPPPTPATPACCMTVFSSRSTCGIPRLSPPPINAPACSSP